MVDHVGGAPHLGASRVTYATFSLRWGNIALSASTS
jgi:hypothetical protein